jgi:hypothetical protein
MAVSHECAAGELNCVSEGVFSDPSCSSLFMPVFNFKAGPAATLPWQPAATCTYIDITKRYGSEYVDATDPANPVLVGVGECMDDQCKVDCLETFRVSLSGPGGSAVCPHHSLFSLTSITNSLPGKSNCQDGCLGPFSAPSNPEFKYYIKHSGNIGQPGYTAPAADEETWPEVPDGVSEPMVLCEYGSPLCVHEIVFSDEVCTEKSFDVSYPLRTTNEPTDLTEEEKLNPAAAVCAQAMGKENEYSAKWIGLSADGTSKMVKSASLCKDTKCTVDCADRWTSPVPSGCIFGGTDSTFGKFWYSSYSTYPTVLILLYSSYCTHPTVLILQYPSYCTHPTAPILLHPSYCTHPTALILLHSSYCTHPTALFLLHSSYCTHPTGSSLTAILNPLQCGS